MKQRLAVGKAQLIHVGLRMYGKICSLGWDAPWQSHLTAPDDIIVRMYRRMIGFVILQSAPCKMMYACIHY
jgi:hypothetical protein